MGKLVVSDANIFIDLIAMGFIGNFFQLSFDIMTVDFIMRELKKSGQKGIVQAYEARKKLTIQTFSACEIDEINAFGNPQDIRYLFKTALYGSVQRRAEQQFSRETKHLLQKQEATV